MEHNVKKLGYGSPTSYDVTLEEPKQGCLGRIPKWYKLEILKVLHLAWPVALTQFLLYLIFPISTAFSGHLGTTQLDAVSLACTVLNVTGMAISTGMATACDTLFSQAYGSGNHKRIGIVLQRGLFVMCMACIPCWAIQLNTETVLILLGQDSEVAYYTGRVVLFHMPGLLANFIFQMLAKYLQNQDVVFPVVVAGVIANSVNALSHYIFLNVLEFGVEGAAISQAIAQWVNMLSVVVYILASKIYVNTWSGWSTEAFKEWGEFITYGVPGFLMIFLDFLCFEAGIFMAGTIGKVELASMAVGHQVVSLVYMLPLGAAIACSIRIGQKLGAGDALGAKRSLLTALTVALFTALMIWIVLTALSAEIPKVFSIDPAVIDLCTTLFPLLAFYAFLDAIGAVLMGALRGCGRHNIAAVTLFIGFWVVGLTIGTCLMFLTVLSVMGFYIGIMIGVLVNDILLVSAMKKFITWENEVRRAQVMSSRENETTSLLGGNKAEFTVDDNDYASFSKPKSSSNALIFVRLIAIIVTVLLLILGVYISVTVKPNNSAPKVIKNVTLSTSWPVNSTITL